MATKIKAITTPWGIASWPSLHELDTKGNYPTSKFNGNIILNDKDAADFERTLDVLMAGERFKNSKPRLPFKRDKDNQFVIVARSTKQPLMFDTKNNPIPSDTPVGGGTIMRLHVGPYNYGDGLSLTLYSVQIKDLKLQTGRTPFEEVDDGFVAPTEDDEVVSDFAPSSSGSALDI